ncbi:GIY-YIG nuclease [Yasminevirus sp. GU-2018]|uniref:GIY-YIG nuclease n=1 Tax=Yasminevirus sp. GU-2018 TaxID=2420051 RepID=A0A5K0UAA9_9VIRU|nr:GIY-YIG nuclease [Yasminevirus sp. GU-2018]
MTDSSDRDDSSEHVLSIDDNDLIVYKKDQEGNILTTYVCKGCIVSKSKKTKRLLYAIKGEKNLSVKIVPNDDEQTLEIRVKHPLYDDDVYTMYDKDTILEISPDAEKSGDEDQTKTNKKPLCYIYILELEQKKYYVGKSNAPMTRTGDHIATTLFDDKVCGGSGWTRMYPPVRILEVISSYDEFDEDRFTLRYMRSKGIDNVRGGSFCELNLTRENVVTLEKMLAGAGDKCYYCGADDHFISACPQKNLKRVAQKHKKTTLKLKDIPKSKIIKFYGAQKLLQNSNINVTKGSVVSTDSKERTTTSNQSKSVKEVKDRDTRSTSPTKEDHNEQVEKSSSDDAPKKREIYRCQYCSREFDSVQKRNNHENITCPKSDKVRRGKMIEANVDAILEANKKYIKDKPSKK